MTLGFSINNLSKINPVLGDYEGVIWFLAFLLVTFSFSPARETILPLLNFNVLKKASTYFYILISVTVPYLLLILSFHYEILLDKNLIFYYKNGLIEGETAFATIKAVFMAPIWEEMFFRGIVLYSLLKITRPFLAISISAVAFSLFHPMYLIITLVAGVLLSLTTYKTKSLIPSIIAHSLWNLYMARLILYF